jgi:16S rRNA processing protein RimM
MSHEPARSALWACGTLGKAHGLKGELYLDLAPGGLEVLELAETFHLSEHDAGGAGDASLCAVTRAGGSDRRPLVRLDLAQTRDEAIALQGRVLYGAGGGLEGRPHYMVDDLIGLTVRYEGRALGEVANVVSAPAQELLVVRRAGARDVLVPLVDELVTVDLEAGVADVVAGLLDDELSPPSGREA